MKKLLKFVIIILFIGNVMSSCSSRKKSNFEENYLIILIDKRLKIAPQVAKSKWNTKSPIDDPIREKKILENIKIQAKKMKIDENLALNFFKDQFEAGKIVQKELHEKWKEERLPPFDFTPNLAQEIRPILDELTPMLLIELKKIQNNTFNKAIFKKKAIELMNSEFSDKVINTSIQSILH